MTTRSHNRTTRWRAALLAAPTFKPAGAGPSFYAEAAARKLQELAAALGQMYPNPAAVAAAVANPATEIKINSEVLNRNAGDIVAREVAHRMTSFGPGSF